MLVTYTHICLQRMIAVSGEMVREGFGTYDTETGIVAMITKFGKPIEVPWSCVEFAVRKLDVPKAVVPVAPKVAPVPVSVEPKGPLVRRKV